MQRIDETKAIHDERKCTVETKDMDLSTKNCEKILALSNNYVAAIVSGSNQTSIYSPDYRFVKIYDIEKNQPILDIKHNAPILTMSVFNNGRLITASKNEIIFRDAQFQPERTLKMEKEISDFFILPNGELVYANSDGISIMSLNQEIPVRPIIPIRKWLDWSINFVGVLDNGNLIAIVQGLREEQLSILDLNSRKELARLALNCGWSVRGPSAVLPHNRVTFGQTTPDIYDLSNNLLINTGDTLIRNRPHKCWNCTFALPLPDGTIAYSYGEGGINIWDPTTMKCLFTQDLGNYIGRICLLPDLRLLAITTDSPLIIDIGLKHRYEKYLENLNNFLIPDLNKSILGYAGWGMFSAKKEMLPTHKKDTLSCKVHL